ncbi:class I mannose-6-phosphate isomerase [Intrasporangium sp.]|uniref:class I mannose-6-phosphate isomerase n=1 Tax=Intrasporangium sp. TaxID=1925024 RepID=UPI00293A1F78|nr:class I mannose-6-phosphate isomerase [Intrasporangium sp.]MDV3220687.1 class I mannose-6-phosphate isomerase [Intrasporangium sp.]
MTTPVAPLPLNTPHRFYRGGERILAFRGLPVPDDFDGHRPEDWLGSTTHLFAEGGDGVTHLTDGADLPSTLANDPHGWLGDAHVARHGVEPGLLTKLLDSGERLPVHSHPDRAFAARHLHCDHGKTEAWLILDADPGATVWVGFRDGLEAEELAALVDAQDERLLASLNPIRVSRGDAILVPAGQPHAIGEGVLLVELQEPTDFSVMLEHDRFGLAEHDAFLGLARATALESVTREPLTTAGLAGLRRRWTDVRGAGAALPADAEEFFRAEVVRPADGEAVALEQSFAVAVVVDGRGTLTTADASGSTLDIASGDVLLIPHGAGEVCIEGDVTVLRCMPPLERRSDPPMTDRESGPS